MYTSTVISAQQYMRDTAPTSYLERIVVQPTVIHNSSTIHLRDVIEPTCPVNMTPSQTCPNYNFNDREYCSTDTIYPAIYTQDISKLNTSYEEENKDTDPIPPNVKDPPLAREETTSVSINNDEKQPTEHTKARYVEVKNESCVNCCIIV
jgi:hypothetical protein